MKVFAAASLLLLVLTFAWQENAAPGNLVKGEPAARATYTRMVESLKGAQSLYIESRCRGEYAGKELTRGTYKLWLKKPSFARMEGISEDGATRGVLVGGGRGFWIYWPNGRARWGFEDSTSWAKSYLTSYMHFPVPANLFSLAHEVNYLGIGIPMTIIEPSVFHGCPDLLEETMDSVSTIGTERIDGEQCTVIEVSYMNGQRMRRLWVSERNNLPRKLTQSIKVASSMMDYEDWTKVEVDRSISDSLFSWKPPDAWTEFRIPDIEEGLLRKGAMVPDFHLRLISGEDFTLSAQRGKPVLVNFWRVGCPPCRDEVPFLQSLHEKYRTKGLIVLGFNCFDDRKIALEFLEKYHAAYPSIVDSSQAAQDVYFSKYQTLRGFSAAPLNYLIDGEGRVVRAWYGYESKGDSTFENALQEVGL